MRQLLVLPLLVLCVACDLGEAGGDDGVDRGQFDDEDTWQDQVDVKAACVRQRVPVDVDGPYRASPGLAARVDSPQTLALRASGERVMTLRRPHVPCVSAVAEVTPWIQGGGLIAHTMTIEELNNLLDEGTAVARLTSILEAGYAYVAIDELAVSNTGWRNGGPRVAQLEQLVAGLAAAGLDRRIIFYVNSYNMVGQLGSYSRVLGTLRDHARIVASEIYVTTRDVKTPVASGAGRCLRSTGCFEAIAAEMSRTAPGINHRSITVLGVSDEYTQGAVDALCDAPGGKRGSLYLQYAKLHAGTLTRLQPGVGSYTFVRIERPNHPSWGATDHVACKNRLDAWSFPRAR
jgi:hypothetical protein